MVFYSNTICIYSGPPDFTVNIVENIENSSVVVQWDAVDDFLTTTYTIVWIGEKDGLPQGASLITLTEQTSYTITGLFLDTVYTITVIATNECGDGPEFGTSFLFYSNTTYTTSSISPSITSSININNEAITTTKNFSSTTNTITTTTATTTINTTANPTNTSTLTEGTSDIVSITTVIIILYFMRIMHNYISTCVCTCIFVT